MFDKIKSLKNFLAGTFTNAHGSSEFEIQKNDLGFVYGETSMIERIAERVAKSIKGVHKVAALVDKPVGTLPLKVRFSIVIKQDYSANEISAKLISEIKNFLNETCGIINATVDVRITDVERATKTRRVK